MPDVRFRTGAGWRVARALHVRTAPGWRALKEAYVRTPSGWRKVWPNVQPLSVVISPNPSQWSINAPYRTSVTALVTGGVGPYTYGWDDTGPQPVPPGNYSGQTKTWESATGGREDAFVSVTVTDSRGVTARAFADISGL